MSLSMSPRFVPLCFRSVLTILGLMLLVPGTAQAQQDTTAITGAIHDSAQTSDQKFQLLMDGKGGLKDTLKDGADSIRKTLLQVEKRRLTESSSASPITEVTHTYSALPLAYATMDQAVHDMMYNRMRELNRVSMQGDGGQPKADYLVDSSLDANIDVQYFDIFMRYFCDPNARDNGKGDAMKGKQFDIQGITQGGKKVSYKVGCGSSDGDIPSRKSVLGNAADTGIEADQIISLPIRPDAMFFSAETFPTRPSNNQAPAEGGETNVNRLANVYYGAFAMSMRFLLGPIPESVDPGTATGGKSAYIDYKANIARKYLATMPFTELFASQLGTMGPLAAKATAQMLNDKLGNAVEDPNIANRIANLKKRNSLSVAEYQDILMNQLMMSPGYYSRINNELSPTELHREMVWLTGMQTALNYQRNHWLEILAALEAVKQQ